MKDFVFYTTYKGVRKLKIMFEHNSVKTRYSNIYEDSGDYCTLHITDHEEHDIKIKVDKEDVDRLKEYFWGYGLVGNKHYAQRCQIRATVNRETIYLARFIMNTDNKVVIINRDQFDYRKNNLYVVTRDGIELRDRNKHNEVGMNNITKAHRKGVVVGYIVSYKTGDKKKQKLFSTRQFNTLDIALEKARNFRDELLGA